MNLYPISQTALLISFLLCVFLSFLLFRKGGRHKLAGIGILLLAVNFFLRIVFGFYSLYETVIWLAPEGLTLAGIFLLVISVTGKEKKAN